MLTIDFLSPINLIISAVVAATLVILPAIAKQANAKNAQRHLAKLRDNVFYIFGACGFFIIGAFYQFYTQRDQARDEFGVIRNTTADIVQTVTRSDPNASQANAGGLGLLWLFLIGAVLFFVLRKLYKMESPNDETPEDEKPKGKKGKK